MTPIQTSDAPAPAGHYSQAIVHNGLVYVAGQLPINPTNREQPVGPIEAQTEQTLRNVEAILKEAGSSLSQVVQMTIYISDISLWSRVNTAYAQVLGDHRPARAIVPTRDLHYGYQIEIQAIAAVADDV